MFALIWKSSRKHGFGANITSDDIFRESDVNTSSSEPTVELESEGQFGRRESR